MVYVVTTKEPHMTRGDGGLFVNMKHFVAHAMYIISDSESRK